MIGITATKGLVADQHVASVLLELFGLGVQVIEVHRIGRQIGIGYNSLVVDQGNTFLGLGQSPDLARPNHAVDASGLIGAGQEILSDAKVIQGNNVTLEGLLADFVISPANDIGTFTSRDGNIKGICNIFGLGKVNGDIGVGGGVVIESLGDGFQILAIPLMPDGDGHILHLGGLGRASGQGKGDDQQNADHREQLLRHFFLLKRM